jgi:hypothetical protein
MSPSSDSFNQGLQTSEMVAGFSRLRAWSKGALSRFQESGFAHEATVAIPAVFLNCAAVANVAKLSIFRAKLRF